MPDAGTTAPTFSKHAKEEPPLRILFLSRAHPPVVGGIESQNASLSHYLGELMDVSTVANRKGKRALPYFLLRAVAESIYRSKDTDVVLLGDAVLAPIGCLLKRLFPEKPVVCILHGLDVTFANRLYQSVWVRRCLPALDHFIAVSRNTKAIAADHGLPPDAISCIPNGVETAVRCERDRPRLQELLGTPLSGRKVLLTLGRLVKRKGVAWFAAEVMPRLGSDYVYVVAGDGPERQSIEALAHNDPRIHVLGAVDDRTKGLLLSSADLFVQPNIPVPGDVEGFGISLIEAGLHGTPVVASQLDGLVDAIEHGQNGWLVSPLEPSAFVGAIESALADEQACKAFGERTRQYVVEHFAWQRVADSYIKALRNIIDRC